MPAISALCRLQHLTIRGSMQKESCLLSLLRVCLPLPYLSELYCYFNVDFGEYTLEYESEEDYEELEDLADPKEELKAILEEAIAARTSEYGSIDTKIKALRFPSSTYGNLGPIIETLEVPDFKDYPSEDIYEEMVRKFCPGLRHLVMPPYYGEDHPATVCSFIRGATGLKTVRGRRFTDAFGSNSSKMMPTLITHHSTTLEELELLECTWISSPVQQAVLASCKNLRRFWVASASNLSCDHGLRFQDIVDGEWSCLGLRELCLTLNRAIDYKSAMVTIQQELSALTDQEVSKENKQEEEEKDLHQLDDPEQKRLVDAWAAKRVYMQIGRLVVLETLALRRDKDTYTAEEDGRVSEWDLTLSEGWLAELAELKNLRHLHMSTDYWSRMGQAEVEFMETEWPLLGEISFELSKSGLRDLVEQPHWQWLKQKRPHVRLTCYQS
ncbi:hypothetical protein BGZ72_008210 [Mortierella alpina]|nr:hypothetical protein BGZ72_008210 [Mortierella alpina]